MSTLKDAVVWFLAGMGMSIPLLIFVSVLREPSPAPADATEMRRAYEYYQHASRGEVPRAYTEGIFPKSSAGSMPPMSIQRY